MIYWLLWRGHGWTVQAGPTERGDEHGGYGYWRSPWPAMGEPGLAKVCDLSPLVRPEGKVLEFRVVVTLHHKKLPESIKVKFGEHVCQRFREDMGMAPPEKSHIDSRGRQRYKRDTVYMALTVRDAVELIPEEHGSNFKREPWKGSIWK